MGKLVYRSKSDAEKELKYTKRKRKESAGHDDVLQVYRCRSGNHFHLGHRGEAIPVKRPRYEEAGD